MGHDGTDNLKNQGDVVKDLGKQKLEERVTEEIDITTEEIRVIEFYFEGTLNKIKEEYDSMERIDNLLSQYIEEQLGDKKNTYNAGAIRNVMGAIEQFTKVKTVKSQLLTQDSSVRKGILDTFKRYKNSGDGDLAETVKTIMTQMTDLRDDRDGKVNVQPDVEDALDAEVEDIILPDNIFKTDKGLPGSPVLPDENELGVINMNDADRENLETELGIKKQ